MAGPHPTTAPRQAAILFILMTAMRDVLSFVDREAHQPHEREHACPSACLVYSARRKIGRPCSPTSIGGAMAVRMMKEQATRHLAVTKTDRSSGSFPCPTFCGMIPAPSHHTSLVVREA